MVSDSIRLLDVNKAQTGPKRLERLLKPKAVRMSVGLTEGTLKHPTAAISAIIKL